MLVQVINANYEDISAQKTGEPSTSWGAQYLGSIGGYIGIARKLLARGANVNPEKSPEHGRTALEGAAEHGRIEMLQILLNEGASIEGTGRRQYIRAIKLAEKRAEFGAVKLLKDHGGWTERDARQYEHGSLYVQESDSAASRVSNTS